MSAGHSRSSQVPPVVAGYFGLPLHAHPEDHPVITSAFAPEQGWRRYPIRKRVTVSWARKMRAEGYTHVALILPHRAGHPADFDLAEIVRGRRA